MKTMKKNTCVPGFVSKLWTLVDSPGTNDVICWSLDGINFRILDEHRFTKEILPKYFKHSNLSSFVRQLNMYGFRKVISIEGGLVKPNLCALEFTHVYFQRGKEDLLEHIKRKISSVRTEDTKISQEDLCKALEDVQQVRGKQDDIDQRLHNMKRENVILWKEVASLRNKHSQQQRTLSKVIQFFASLVQGNCIIGIKNKRPLMLDVSETPPAKISRPCVLSLDQASIAMFGSSNGCNSPSSSGISIVDITDNAKQGTSTTGLSAADGDSVLTSSNFMTKDKQENVKGKDPNPSLTVTGLEDDILDSILQEGGSEMASHQRDVTLNRNDIQCHLDGVDSSFEDLQTLLLGKQFNIKAEFIENLFNPDLSDAEMDMPENAANMELVSEWSGNTTQQSVQESAFPLEDSKGSQHTPAQVLSLLEELCCTLDSDKEVTSSGTPKKGQCPIQPANEDTGTTDLSTAFLEDFCIPFNDTDSTPFL
ncbi:hypothetical protein AGOR_G00019050 [Albula goreensis]|uniref:HSF-type DNA-binding domain-containing protein n=1 Tax=Albula goreensis TaxID=1534307 RepID=A0A8T3E0D4_9TELE|nr:hypothetical protein AGOR_G00019050 [Albula goreensis]